MATKEKVQEWSLIRHPNYKGDVSILHEECRNTSEGHDGTVIHNDCNNCNKPIPNHILIQREIANAGS